MCDILYPLILKLCYLKHFTCSFQRLNQTIFLCRGYFLHKCVPIFRSGVPILRSGIVAPGIFLLYRGLHTVVLCKSRGTGPAPSNRHTRHISSRSGSEYRIQWQQLWEFIKPDVVLLVLAVAVSTSSRGYYNQYICPFNVDKTHTVE